MTAGDRPRHRWLFSAIIFIGLVVCLSLAYVSNPVVQLKLDIATALSDADQLVVHSGGGGFDLQSVALGGEEKKRFIDTLSPLLQIECHPLLSIGNRTSSRPAIVIYALQHGQCSKQVVIRTSRRAHSLNSIERLRADAQLGTSVAALPTCSQEETIFYWFGMPYEYEYVVRP
jgi:hypothetical protein